MGFRDDLTRFEKKVAAKNQAVFVATVAAAKTSIVEGSAVTGAPGQPVDTGNLKGSWQVEFETPTRALISTNVAYAKSIEDGVSYAHGGTPMTVRSQVGGFHSIALTIAGLDKIVAAETERLAE